MAVAALCAGMFLACLPRPACAVVYYWDPNGVTPAVGGSGTWDTVSLQWTTGTTTGPLTAWPNGNPNADMAIFLDSSPAAPNNTVTIASDTTVYVNYLNLQNAANANFYTFQGGNSNSVLAFSGAGAQVGSGTAGSNIGATFTNITIDTGSGVGFWENGASTPFNFNAGTVFTGTGPVNFTSGVSSNYGARANINAAQASFAGGFNVAGGFHREALLSASVADSLGTGAATVAGFARISYVWGAQTAVEGVTAGVTASSAGVIDLSGTYGSSNDRFIIKAGGILRGSSTDLGRISRVLAFSGSPTGPEAILNPGAIVASTTNSISTVPAMANLGTSADLILGLGTGFNTAALSVNMGAGTPWKGFANDANEAAGNGSFQRLSQGTFTITTGSGFNEFVLLSQGAQYGTVNMAQNWAGSSPHLANAGYGFVSLTLGNGTTLPTFTLADGSSAIPARIPTGSEVVLDGSNFSPAAFSKYAVSEQAMLVSSRSNAINGKDVDLDGGLLGVNYTEAGGGSGGNPTVTDTAGTVTLSRQARLFVRNKTAGTPDSLTINTLTRSGNALVEVFNNGANKLGGDERIFLGNNASLVRGNIVDPFIFGAWNGAAQANFLSYGANGLQNYAPYATTIDGLGDGVIFWGNGALTASKNADSIILTGALTGSAYTLNLGVLPDGSQAARTAILVENAAASYTHSANFNAGTSELIYYSPTNSTFRVDTFSGNITAAALTIGSGKTVVLNGAANNISGPVTIWGNPTVVTINSGAGNGFGPSAGLLTIGSPYAIFDLTNISGNTQTVAGLAGNGTVNIASGKTLSMSNPASPATFSGAISGAGNIKMTGGGTQTLSGVSYYTGATTIDAGTLVANGGASAGVTRIGNVYGQAGPGQTQGKTDIVFMDPTGLVVGQPVTGTNVPAGVFITAINPGAGITISANLSSAGAYTLTFPTGSATGSGAVTVSGTGTLAGSGVIAGAVTANAGGTIAPGGVGSIGTFTLNGGLTTNGNSTLNFDLLGYTGGDLLNVNNGLTVGLGAAMTFGTNPSIAGNYRLIGGSFGTPTLGNFVLPAAPGGATYALSTGVDTGYIDLVVSIAATKTWTGQAGGVANGTWDIGIGTPTNWTAGSGPTTYDEPVSGHDKVVFDDSAVAPGTTAITLNTTVSPTDITFNNSSLAYSISGSGTITGITGMTIKGGGSVTLNSGVIYGYSGPTAVSNNSTLVLNGTLASSDVSLSGANIGGAGGIMSQALTTSGASSMTAGSTLSVTGATTIAGGTFTINGGANLAANGGLAVSGGELAGTGMVTGNATMSGGTINFGSSGNITGTLGVTGGAWNGAGSVGGLVTVSSGALTIGSGANLTASAGLAVSGSGSIVAIDGTSMITGDVTYSSSIGSNYVGSITGGLNYTSPAASTISGSIAGSGKALVMNNAAGTLTLGAANALGSLSVNAGTLNLMAANTITNGLSLSGGTVNVYDAGALGVQQVTSLSGASAITLRTQNGGSLAVANDIVASGSGSTLVLGGVNTGTGLINGSFTGHITINDGATLSAARPASGGHHMDYGNGGGSLLSFGPNSGPTTKAVLEGFSSSYNFAGLDAPSVAGSGPVVSNATTGSVAQTDLKVTVGTGLSYTFAGQIKDGNINALTAFIKAGLGTQILSGDNTLTGGITVDEGILVAAHTGALGAAGVGTVKLSQARFSAGTVDLATDTSVNAVNLQLGTNVNWQNGDSIVGTVLADVATPGGAGITHTFGKFDFWGGANFGIGRLAVAAGGNVSGGSPAIAVSGTTTLKDNGGPSTFILDPTTATISLNNVTSTLNVGGGPNTATLTLGGNSAGNQITGAIDNGTAGGVVALMKLDTSTWTLGGANLYTKNTTVNGGVLKAAHNNALGFGGAMVAGQAVGTTTVQPSGGPTSATLDLSGVTVNEPITLNGGTLINSNTGTPSTLDNGVAGVSFTNAGTGISSTAGCPFSLTITGGGGSGASIRVLTVDGGGGILTYSLNAVGSGYTDAPTGVTGGSGTDAVFNGNSDNFQAVSISTTAPGSGYTAAPTVTPSSGTGLDPVATISSLALIGAGNQIGGDGDLTIKPAITGNSSAALTKIGNGRLTLPAANTYGGDTTVSAGTLTVTGSILDTSGVTVAAPGVLELSNASGSVLTATTHVANDGLLRVTTGGQEVAFVDGLGTTNVTGGLTADSIIQGTLSIGAGGTVTIRPTTAGFGQGGTGSVNSASQVPEPGTWVLLAAGAACLLPLVRRQRRRDRQPHRG
jgi:autotransporter-associated beta strand protein